MTPHKPQIPKIPPTPKFEPPPMPPVVPPQPNIKSNPEAALPIPKPVPAQEGKAAQLSVPVNDEVASRVTAFLAEKQGAVAAEAAATEPPKTELPPDKLLTDANPDEMLLRSAMVDTRNIEVTDLEKDLFIKALLTETPVKFTIVLFDGKLALSFRSRTMHEQKRILDSLYLDIAEKRFPDNDPAQFYTRLQQYMTALMLERVNGQVFSDLTLTDDKDSHTLEALRADADKLRDIYHRKLANMGHVKWVAILNGLRQFEAKCRKMEEECANENFWKPQG